VLRQPAIVRPDHTGHAHAAVPVTGHGVAELLSVAIGYVVAQVACAAAVLVSPATRRTDVEVRAP
jgi:hypothetical protein